jgi:hypothetical protein
MKIALGLLFISVILLGIAGCTPGTSSLTSPAVSRASPSASGITNTTAAITPLTEQEKTEIKNAVVANPTISDILRSENTYNFEFRWLAITGINYFGQPLKVPLKEDGTPEVNGLNNLPKSSVIYPSVLVHLGNPENKQLRIAVDRQSKQVILMDSLVVRQFNPLSGNIILSLEIKTTMQGVYAYLAVGDDGTVAYRYDEGLRFPLPGNEAIQTIKIGKVEKDELASLAELFRDPVLGDTPEYQANTQTIDTASQSVIAFSYQSISKIIKANYNIRQSFLSLPDVASQVKEIFLRLNYIIDFDTRQESRDLIAITPRS